MPQLDGSIMMLFRCALALCLCALPPYSAATSTAVTFADPLNVTNSVNLTSTQETSSPTSSTSSTFPTSTPSSSTSPRSAGPTDAPMPKAAEDEDGGGGGDSRLWEGMGIGVGGIAGVVVVVVGVMVVVLWRQGWKLPCSGSRDLATPTETAAAEAGSAATEDGSMYDGLADHCEGCPPAEVYEAFSEDTRGNSQTYENPGFAFSDTQHQHVSPTAYPDKETPPRQDDSEDSGQVYINCTPPLPKRPPPRHGNMLHMHHPPPPASLSSAPSRPLAPAATATRLRPPPATGENVYMDMDGGRAGRSSHDVN
ncbi:hypothetical protein ACOMHN_049625 [Nucella lapillus]